MLNTAQEYCHKKFHDAIIARVRGALSGGKRIVKHLKSFGRKCFDKTTVGTVERLLFIKRDEELKSLNLQN